MVTGASVGLGTPAPHSSWAGQVDVVQAWTFLLHQRLLRSGGRPVRQTGKWCVAMEESTVECVESAALIVESAAVPWNLQLSTS